MQLISIIIPCYNEEAVITTTYHKLTEVLKGHDFEYELIFIDDGSADATCDLLRTFAARDLKTKVLMLSRNFGHQAAVSAGLHQAAGAAAVIIDADLQDPPEVIPEMIKAWREGKGEVIYGRRAKRKGETFLKKFSAHLFYRILNMLSDVPFPADTGDFRLIDRKVVLAYRCFHEKNKYLRGLFSWMGYRQYAVSYIRDPRFAGKTKYTLKKMLKLAGDGIFNFSKKPLTLAINLGILSLFIGFILIIWMFYVHFFSLTAIPGWSSTITTIIFFGGIQLLSIGILGRYIGSIFDEVKNRPEFLIRESLNTQTNE
jgi:glycosyltransferase involved in cell wall biosynthesis